MKHYKIVIIDDEPFIIEGLKILINWNEYGCEIVGSATKGDSGLFLIEQLKPDIVITDIRMPNMTGIEMIRRASSICNCSFIVLSGYSDFNYARKCMNLGVNEYLLKPVEEELLIKSLIKVQKKIEEENKHKNALIKLKSRDKQLRELSNDLFLRDFVNMYFDTLPDLLFILNNYEINIPIAKAYVCVMIQFPDHNCNILDLREPLIAVLNQVIDDHYLLFSYNDNSYMCILSFSELVEKEYLSMKTAEVIKNLQLLLDKTINIGFGNIYSDMLKINLSAKQARYALSYQIVRGSNSINPFSSDLKNAYFIMSIPDELWEDFNDNVLKLDFSKISKAIRKIYGYMQELKDMPFLGIQINSFNLILMCIQKLNEIDIPGQLINFENMNCFNQITTMKTLEELSKYIENIIYNIINTVKNEEFKKPSGIIPAVENYLYEHIYEDLSLLSVSQLFYISPIYLSQLFKKETGQLYIDYLTTLKMNTAKNLLITTDLMIYEIADKLGYKDTKYFSQLFEKKIGSKPSEFRKRVYNTAELKD